MFLIPYELYLLILMPQGKKTGIFLTKVISKPYGLSELGLAEWFHAWIPVDTQEQPP